jgi:hypothetical protein
MDSNSSNYYTVPLGSEEYVEEVTKELADELDLQEGKGGYFSEPSIWGKLLSGSYINLYHNRPVVYDGFDEDGNPALMIHKNTNMNIESAVREVEGLDFEDIDEGLSGSYEDSDLERSNV